MSQIRSADNRWDRYLERQTQKYAQRALRAAGCAVHEASDVHRYVILNREEGHIQELHVFTFHRLVTLKVTTSIIFHENEIPAALPLLLLEQNDCIVYGSFRLLRFGVGRMLVHGIVLDTLVLPSPTVAGVIVKALLNQTGDMIRRLVRLRLVPVGSLVDLNRFDSDN